MAAVTVEVVPVGRASGAGGNAEVIEVAPRPALRHLHSAHDIEATRYIAGLRYVTYRCECGELLPERLG